MNAAMSTTIPFPSVDWGLLAPVILLCAGALIVTIIGIGPRGLRRHAGAAALLSLVAPAIAVLRLWDRSPHALETLGGMIRMDHFALCFHALFLVTAALAVLLSMTSLKDQRDVDGTSGDYWVLLLFATAGMMLMSASNHLLVLFLGLEILSLPLYILAGYTRWQDRSLEASIKYFLLGAFSTGFTIYGMALMYAGTGTLDLSRMVLLADATGDAASSVLLLGFGLAMVGFLFKIAAFPFHYWLPDVYQGAPTPVTAFMIAGTKAAAFAAVLRVVTAPMFWDGDFTPQWTKLLTVLAALTMTAGNVVALVQRDIKRMLAFSSVAHAGYVLVAVVARSEDGISSVVFYLAAYLFMNIGAFAVILAIDRARGGRGEGEDLASFAGLGRRHPALAAAMTLFMLSLTGVPLTAGFLGKFYVFKAAVDSELYGLAAVGLLNSALAAAYYLNVVVTMYMREPVSEPPAVTMPLPLGIGIAAGAAGVIYLGIFPSRVLELASGLLL